MKCDKCKKEIKDGIRKDLHPNAIGFELENGKEITLCYDCLCKLGKATEKEKDIFFAELGY